MRAGRLGFGVAVCVAVALLGGAGARGAASLSLDVTFAANGSIAVTLTDGTPVGTSSGAPTVIPAGYYPMLLTGPMGLPGGLPYFHLTGPGVDFLSNLNEGGLASDSESVTFAPDSTYTWMDDAMPGVVFTFTTSASVQSGPTSPTSPNVGPPAAGPTVIGSKVVKARGTLTGHLTSAGRLTLTRAGKTVTRLAAGRYRIDVIDGSPHRAVELERSGRVVRRITAAALVGKRSVVVSLTAGTWSLVARPDGAKAVSFVVS